MSFSFLLSLTAKLMPVSTECAVALLSFGYPSIYFFMGIQDLELMELATTLKY